MSTRQNSQNVLKTMLICLVVLSDAFTYRQPQQIYSVHYRRSSNDYTQRGPILPPYDLMAKSPNACTTLMMTQNEENEAVEEDTAAVTFTSKIESFFDAMLEIPDTRLFAGDILFLLIVNFLLQIASEVGDPNFWQSGGFSQPVTMPTTLLALVVRDSKMTISWILGGLWNRAYSTAAVSSDEVAAKKAFDVWVDYFSIRIILELTGSVLVTHTPVDVWPLAQEVWYTLIVMSFYRLAYGRFLSGFF